MRVFYSGIFKFRGSTKEYKDADVVLIGVSRSGKTPTSLYLAMQFGGNTCKASKPSLVAVLFCGLGGAVAGGMIDAPGTSPYPTSADPVWYREGATGAILGAIVILFKSKMT